MNNLKKQMLLIVTAKMTNERFLEWVQEGEWDYLARGEYRCRHFSIKELVDSPTLVALGEEGCWALFDVESLIALDWLRVTFGRTTVNGGHFTESGFRTVHSEYYSKKSMHSVGRAFDCKFLKFTAMEARSVIISKIRNGEFVPSAIRRMENHVNWLHFDNKVQLNGFEDRWITDPLGNKVCYLFQVAPKEKEA